MVRHGREMTQLVRATALLERHVVIDLANTIAAEPRFTRPTQGADDELNAAIPERFFVLQDELRSRAKSLAEAAGGRDNELMGNRFGELVHTCISCHAAFREPK
jgi:hypothetical protein